MNKVQKDLNFARNIMSDNLDNFPISIINTFGSIYAFSNEDLTSAFDNFDFTDKNCLTVLGSSDQTLDMFFRGAKSITTFDVNPLTKYYFYLKKAALLSNISKEAYIEFFHPYYGYGFDISIFWSIVEYLEGDNLKFWSTIFDEVETFDICFCLMSMDINTKKELPEKTKYLNGNNYYKLREKIKDLDIKFINTNIKDLPKKLKQNYDLIYLSNIMQYATQIFEYKKEDKIKSLTRYKNLITKLSNKLNNNGTITNYVFNYPAQSEALDKVFESPEFEHTELNNKENKDIILTYTKK